MPNYMRNMYIKQYAEITYVVITYAPIALGTVFLYGSVRGLAKEWTEKEENPVTFMDFFEDSLAEICYDFCPITASTMAGYLVLEKLGYRENIVTGGLLLFSKILDEMLPSDPPLLPA